MEKFEGLFKAFLNLLFTLFDELKVFGKDSKLTGTLQQYVEDAETVAGVAFGK
jgi:hypothetical protein